MKTIAALGSAGGFLFVVRGWVGLAVVLWVAARVSQQLAMALFKEAIKAGWFDETR